MASPIIHIEHLSVRYDGQAILKDLSLEIQKGEIVAVVGPNGSGKTTFIRAVLGLIPYQGNIRINGQPVKASLTTIGYVPQRFSFDRSIPMTVREFLALSFKRVPPRKLKHALLEVDMTEYENHQIGSLSGGQFQRVLIARSLLNDPLILVLDEATSEIDSAGAKSFYDIISHLNKVHGTTVILVSHEINMVYKFADHIICLNRELVCYGKPKEAITKEVLERLYGEDIRFQEHRH